MPGCWISTVCPKAARRLPFSAFYLRRLVVPAAASVGLREEYAYLEKSLERFPAGPEQERLARQAGFAEANHRSLVAGQMGVLILRA